MICKQTNKQTNPPTHLLYNTFCGGQTSKKIKNKRSHHITRTQTHKHTLPLTAGSRCHFQRHAELIKIHKYKRLSTRAERGEKRELFLIVFIYLFLISLSFCVKREQDVTAPVEDKKSSNLCDITIGVLRFTTALVRKCAVVCEAENSECIQKCLLAWCRSIIHQFLSQITFITLS